MPIRTMAAVLLRGADETVDQRGTATLLTPTQLIVHPPFNDRFATEAPDPTKMSVCITTWGGDAPAAELIAVNRIGKADEPVEGADGQQFTIVGIELQSASTAPRLAIDHTPAAIAAHLADPFNGAAVVFTHIKEGHDPNVLCHMCNLFC